MLPADAEFRRDLEAKGIGVADITLSRPSLDDVFLQITGKEIRE